MSLIPSMAYLEDHQELVDASTLQILDTSSHCQNRQGIPEILTGSMPDRLALRGSPPVSDRPNSPQVGGAGVQWVKSNP